MSEQPPKSPSLIPPPGTPLSLVDLHRPEVVRAVLEGEDEGRHAELARKLGISEKERRVLAFHARQRRDALQECEAAVVRRVKQDPKPTPTERAMGRYIEQIEPQIQQAVLALRRKGYKIGDSGFADAGEYQTITFSESYPTLNNSMIPREFEVELEALRIDVAIQPDFLMLDPRWNTLTLQELKVLWDRVVALLPTIGPESLEPDPNPIAPMNQFV